METISAKGSAKPSRGVFVGLGELVWDLFPASRTPGGAPANFAFHVAKLGGHSSVVSAVGQDLAGDELKAWLRQAGLDTLHIQTSSLPTGSVTVDVDETGHPTYEIRPDVAWDTLAWNDALAELAVAADCVCVGSLSQRSRASQETIHRFLSTTSPTSIRIFDLNLRQPHLDISVIENTLPLVNVLKLNDTEWTWIAGKLRLDLDWSRGLTQLMERTDLKLIALTRGAEGSALVNEEGVHWLPGEPIEVRDTVGAGDAFAAALAVGMIRRDNIALIHRNAAALANFVCTQPGATTVPRLTLHGDLGLVPSNLAAHLQNLTSNKNVILPLRDRSATGRPEEMTPSIAP